MKKKHLILTLLISLVFTGCNKEDIGNTKPHFMEAQSITYLSIVDKNGVDLLATNLILDKDGNIISPYTIRTMWTSDSREEKDTITEAWYAPKRFQLGFQTKFEKGNDTLPDGTKGNLHYKIQLPTVFKDDRIIQIDAKWTVRYDKSVEMLHGYNRYVEHEDVFVNGKPIILESNRELTVKLVVDDK